jgi:hypothetical protein
VPNTHFNRFGNRSENSKYRFGTRNGANGGYTNVGQNFVAVLRTAASENVEYSRAQRVAHVDKFLGGSSLQNVVHSRGHIVDAYFVEAGKDVREQYVE